MKKKVWSVILAAGMSSLLLGGCGKSTKDEIPELPAITAEKIGESETAVSPEEKTPSDDSAPLEEAAPEETGRASETDGSAYIGEYLDSDVNEPMLTITASEDGKYHVEIGIYRLTTIDDGVGEVTQDGLQFTATDAAGNPIGGIITLNGDEAVVTFTDSTWGYLQNGDTFLYTRADGASDVPKREQEGTAGSNIPLKDDPEEAEYQIRVAMQYLLEELYGDKVYDARIYVEKLYTTEEEQEEPLSSYHLGPDEVAFEVHYELKLSEGTDPNEFLAGSGAYDEESGWVTEKYNVGVLRPNEGGEPPYRITDFGTGF